MKVSFINLWLTAVWRYTKEKFRNLYFNSNFYNKSLKIEPVSRIYDIHNIHILKELQDRDNKNYLLAQKFKKNIWKINTLKPNKINDLHKFSWLPHIDIKKDKDVVKSIIQEWLDHFSNYKSSVWHPAIISSRLIFWITSAPITIRNEDLIFRTKITNVVLKQALHLSKNFSLIRSPIDRILGVLSLILVSTAFEGYKKLLESSLKKLQDQTKDILDKKGFVKSRNIQDQFWMLHHLILIKESLKISQNPIPETLEDTIEIVGKHFSSLLYANNNVPLFNGAKEYDCTNFVQFLKLKGYKFNSENNETNFLFGKIKKLEVMMDANNPPHDAFAQNYQAGCLSFELVHAGVKIITNTGSASNFSKELAYISQSTAAQSCLVINDTSSCLFQKSPLLRKYYGNALLEKSQVTNKDFKQDKIIAHLKACHNGYSQKYASLFERHIVMNGEENIVNGEDTITVSKNDYAFLNFSIRFHVLPDARLIRTHGGDILISVKNQGWKFKCKNYDVKTENSLYFAENDKVQETSCIVVEGTLKQEMNKILWSIEKTN